MHEIHLDPPDEFNRRLVRHTHPPEWRNPTGRDRYDLVVIGGGTGGLVSAAIAAALGASVALIERNLLGGDCLNTGCVPSKALLAAARRAYDARHSAAFGVHAGEVQVDFPAVMERMRRLRSEISRNDSAARFQKMGVDVYLGEARFTGEKAVEVGGRWLGFKRCIVATGSRPKTPKIEGLAESGFLTNETLFSLTQLPRRLAVLGGGPIGTEMVQAFRRFGAEVDLLQRSDRLLPKDDAEASTLVRERLQREGVRVHLHASLQRVEKTPTGKRLTFNRNGSPETIEVDELLVAVGRTANVDSLKLEAAGVKASGRGIETDDYLRTANHRIYAVGDVAGAYQFTHAADAMARLAVQNALLFGRKKLSDLVIPWTTYTDPEVAHVGLTPQTAAEKKIKIDTYRQDLRDVDRAVLEGDDSGFAAVHTRRGTGKIVGATIVGRDAGNILAEVVLAMTRGLSLDALSNSVHAYPTTGEALRRAADQYRRTQLTPLAKQLLRLVINRRR